MAAAGRRGTMTRTLAISLENRPGAFAEIADLLGRSGVDILGFSTQALGDFGQVYFYVDKIEEGRKALEAAGVRHRTREVVLTEIPDHPGGLAHLARTLANANVNIELAFNAVGSAIGRAAVVLEVSDVKGAIAALEKAGLPVIEGLARTPLSPPHAPGPAKGLPKR
ncbi:MAG: hypothetical protein ACYDDF_13045 [Thermoplasmatota archaeon]